LSKVSFDKTCQHIIIAALCCRILEIAHSFLQLLDKEGSLAVLPSISRGLLEAYADLINLIRDKNYLSQMEILFYKHKKKIALFSKNVEGDNSYLSAILDEVDIEKVIQEAEDEMSRCKSEGAFDNFNIKKKFERADLLNEYQSIYPLLCLHTHNNVYELERQHIMIENEKISLLLLEKNEPNRVYGLVDIIGALLVGTLQHVCEMTEQKELMHPANDALERLRLLYAPSFQ